MSVPMELVPLGWTDETAPVMEMALEKTVDVEGDVDELGDVDKKDVMTEKEKRRLEILLEEETPALSVDPSIISRLNVIDRELNMLKGERLKEGGRRSVSPQEEDVVAICDNGWNEAQNRLDQIEENMAVIQTTNQRQRLLPLRDSKNQISSIKITEDFSDENED